MNVQTNTASVTPNTPTNTDKFEWTCVSWYNKISNAVTNKSCHFLGVAVASFTGFFTFIPSLAVDLGYAVKRLYDRKIKTPQTPVQNFMTSDGSKRPNSDRDPTKPIFISNIGSHLQYNYPAEVSSYSDRSFSSTRSQSATDSNLSGHSDKSVE